MKKPRGLIDITNQRFGALRAVEYVGPIKYGRASWRCTCDCGQSVIVDARTLRTGMKKACCLNGHFWQQETGAYGGLSRKHSAEYRALYDARRRCEDRRHWRYKDYGAKGIRVCDRWHDFKNFLADMGPRPSKNYSLDRYPDPHGNYEPGNCRWATREEQHRNMRNSVYVEYKGERVLLLDVLKEAKIKRTIVRGRLNTGWSLEDALTVPIRAKKKNQRK